METLREKIVSMEYELKKIDSDRIRLQGRVDHTELALEENKITNKKDEQWVINTRFSLRDRKRKLKELNLKREALKTEICSLKKEIRKEKQRRLDSTFERLFILNAKNVLDKEVYEKIRDMAIEDMKIV